MYFLVQFRPRTVAGPAKGVVHDVGQAWDSEHEGRDSERGRGSATERGGEGQVRSFRTHSLPKAECRSGKAQGVIKSVTDVTKPSKLGYMHLEQGKALL